MTTRYAVLKVVLRFNLVKVISRVADVAFVFFSVGQYTGVHLLPPAKFVCEGYVFTGVCLPKMMGGFCPIACWDTPSFPKGPEADNPIPPNRHPPPCAVHAGVRSTSGRYASHWNAFLLLT